MGEFGRRPGNGNARAAIRREGRAILVSVIGIAVRELTQTPIAYPALRPIGADTGTLRLNFTGTFHHSDSSYSDAQELQLSSNLFVLARRMDWCQIEENDWFDKYLPGQDLPDGLQRTPFNVDLTTLNRPRIHNIYVPKLGKSWNIMCRTMQLTSFRRNVTKRTARRDYHSEVRRPGSISRS